MENVNNNYITIHSSKSSEKIIKLSKKALAKKQAEEEAAKAAAEAAAQTEEAQA